MRTLVRRAGLSVCGLAAVSTIALAPAPAEAATVIGLFQNSSYGGCAYYGGLTNIAHMGSVKYNDRLPSGGLDPACDNKYIGDQTSSISNGSSCTARLYTDASYHGHYQNIAPHSQVAHVTYNDQYSSLRFYC